MGRALILVSVSLCAACKTPPEPDGIGGFEALTEVVRVDLTDSVGPAPHAGLVRSVNALGASVPGGPRTLTIDGVAQEVSFDATGYGVVTVAEPGSVDVWDADRGATFHAVPLTEAELSPGLPGTPPFPNATAVAGASGGMLVAVGAELWWSEPGLSPHRVLAFPDGRPIEGLRALRIDDDELVDAVAWGGDTVALLRGRFGGGMWGAGAIRLEGLRAAGVSAGDVTGDFMADIVVAWHSPIGEHLLQVWQGNGLFAFEDWPEVRLASAPGQLAVGANTADGTVQITILSATEPAWTRYQIVGRELFGVGPGISIPAEPGSDVFSGYDLNNDGGDELVILGPRVDDAPRNMRLYDLNEPDVDRVSFIDQSYQGAWFGIADGNNDGLEDVFVLEQDGRLLSLAWGGQNYSQRRALDARDAGPFALTDIDGDARPELFVAGEAGRWWPGAVRETTDGEWWTADAPEAIRYPLNLIGPIAAAPATAGVGVLGFTLRQGTLNLVRWRLLPPASPGLSPSITEDFATSISPDAPLGVDLDVCDGVAWALMQGSLVRVRLDTGAVTGRVATTATRVACGAGPQGAAAVLLEGGMIRLLSDSLADVSTEARAGAVDVAIGPQGGVARVATCERADCRVVPWTWGEGASGFAVGTPDLVEVVTSAGPKRLPGSGVPSIVDLGTDGLADLVMLQGEGVFGVFPATGDGFGAGRFRHIGAALVGAVIAGDANTDGSTDFIAADGEGYLVFVAGAIAP